MPRRKKAVLSQLPPLVFVNSPVFLPAPVLTPDQAVDNPVTARAVPIENLTENAWVSPQFRALHGKQRCQSTRRNHHFLSHISTDARQQVEPSRCVNNCKFRPLQFLNDNHNKLEKQILRMSELSVCSESHTGEGGAYYNIYHTNHEASLANCIGLDMDNINNIIVHTPVITEQDECCKISSKHNSTVSINKSSCSVPNVRDGTGSKKTVETTPVRVVHAGGSARQRLLTPKTLFCERTLVNSNVPNQSFSTNDHSDNLQRVTGLINFNTCGKTMLKSPKNNSENINKKNSNVTADEIALLVSHSEHISNKSTSKTPPEAGREAALLVIDTPQCDYGLTFRQRQLKYRLN